MELQALPRGRSRPMINSGSTPNRLRIDTGSTPERLQTDHASNPDRPRLLPISHAHVRMPRMHAGVHAHACVRMLACVHVYVYAYVHMHMHVHGHVHMHACACVHACVSARAYVRVHQRFGVRVAAVSTTRLEACHSMYSSTPSHHPLGLPTTLYDLGRSCSFCCVDQLCFGAGDSIVPF